MSRTCAAADAVDTDVDSGGGSTLMRIGLIGCVKSKLPYASKAADLYTSPLFRGRRRFVEESCERWFILSAEHGLVEPNWVLAPYNKTLTHASVSARRAWAQGVLSDLETKLGTLSDLTFELHAGAAYLNHGLVSGLLDRGGHVDNPTAGLPLGTQLAFYRERRQWRN